MLRPGHQVLRREAVEERLLVVRRRVGRIDPVRVAEDDAFRIGVPALEDGVAGRLFLLSHYLRGGNDNKAGEKRMEDRFHGGIYVTRRGPVETRYSNGSYDAPASNSLKAPANPSHFERLADTMFS